MNEVKVLITAKDSATPAIKGVAGGIIAAEAATKALKIGLDFAIGSAVKFERDMDQVGAVLGATEGDMKRLRTEALKIGADTSKSAGEAAAAMEELAAGGRSVAQIMGGEARAAVNLAEAGNYGLADSARTIATTMDVWKDTTIATTDVVNRLAGAANASRFGVEDMSQAIAAGGGVAASAGVDFQEFSTAIAATASSFNSGSDAGTSFKTFITALSGNSEKAKGAIRDLGLSFYDAQGQMRPMAAIVQELHDKIGPLSQEQQTLALKTIFGNDAFRTAAGLMKLTGDEFAAMSAKMGNTNAAEIAKQRMGNLSGSIEELKGSLETIGIELGTQAIPALTRLADAGVTAVNAFGGLPDSTQNLILLGTAAAASMPMLVSGAEKATGAVKSLGLAMQTTSGKAGLMAAGIGAAVVATDLLLTKTTGAGLVDRLFGDVGRMEAAGDALKEWDAALIAAGPTADRVSLAMARLSQVTDEASTHLGNADHKLQDTATAAGALLGPLGGAAAHFATAGDRILGFNVGMSEGEDRIKAYEEKVRLLGGAMVASGATVTDLAEAYHSLNPALQKAFDEATNIEAAMKTQEFAMASAATATDGWMGSIKAAAPALADMTTEMEDAAKSADDLKAAIENVAKAFSELNPEAQALRAEHALLSEELEDIRDKGDGATAAERERARVIEEQLIPALDKQIKRSDDNQKAVEGITEAVQRAIGPDALPRLKEVMDDVGRSHEQQIDVMGLLARAYNDVRTGDIPALMSKMEELKAILSPEEWKALALNSGNALGQGFQQGVYNQMEPSKEASEALIEAAIAAAEMSAYPGGNTVGSAMAAGVAAGIAAAEAVGAVAGAARSLIDAAVGAMRERAEIQSPSKLMSEQVGLPIALGIAEGIFAGQKEISVAAEAAVDAAWKPAAAKLEGYKTAAAATFTGWQPVGAAAGAGTAGGWSPSSAALASTDYAPTGAYGQALVYDEQNNAWTYPWMTGGAFGARGADGGLIHQPFGGQAQPQSRPVVHAHIEINGREFASAVLDPWMEDQLTTGALSHGVRAY